MTEREEWTEWFLHDGKGCPCPGAWVNVRGEKGSQYENRASDPAWEPNWNWEPKHERIISYRIRKPRALIQLREMIENLPAPSRQKEGAHD